MAKNIAVYGIYANRPMVEKAVDELKAAGFRNADISVLFPVGGATKEFAVEKETKAPEGAATGAGTGAVIGGLRMAGGYWFFGHPGSWAFYCGRSHHGCSCWSRSWRIGRRDSRSADWHGYSRV